uniref:T-cell surface glycoprotein CD3 zeta chain-like isoform X1 n=1 Tax=Solea senegalensis TaxID=28829 RepID=UPI001CD8C669|nr:T-cell surface glycoprotein CD3 zeta chain-like isoform X1 [Solea senegalensis]
MHLYDPGLCYILDGFLGLYGLIITGMFIKERFFKAKVKSGDDAIYTDLKTRSDGGYDGLMRDTERGRNRWTDNDDATYTVTNIAHSFIIIIIIIVIIVIIIFVKGHYADLSAFILKGLNRRTEGEYKELPVKRERQRKTEKVYQDLSSVTRDTYDSLQMQPLPAR